VELVYLIGVDELAECGMESALRVAWPTRQQSSHPRATGRKIGPAADGRPLGEQEIAEDSVSPD
jgi:hypothetical protein